MLPVDDAKAPAAKHLAKWRPQVLELESKPIATPSVNELPKSEDNEDSAPPAVISTNASAPGDSEQMKANQGALAVAAAG